MRSAFRRPVSSASSGVRLTPATAAGDADAGGGGVGGGGGAGVGTGGGSGVGGTGAGGTGVGAGGSTGAAAGSGVGAGGTVVGAGDGAEAGVAAGLAAATAGAVTVGVASMAARPPSEDGALDASGPASSRSPGADGPTRTASRGAACPTWRSALTRLSGVVKPEAPGAGAPAAFCADSPADGPPPRSRNDPITRKSMPDESSRARKASKRLGGPPGAAPGSGFPLTGRGSKAIAPVAVGGTRLARGSGLCAGADQQIFGVYGPFLELVDSLNPHRRNPAARSWAGPGVVSR